MARSVSDGEILHWLGAFVASQAICMGSLVWAIEHMKSHIDTSSAKWDLVVWTFCCAALISIAIVLGISNAVILGPVASYYGSHKADNSHGVNFHGESQKRQVIA